MKFNFNWNKNNKPEMTPELTEQKVNVYHHMNHIKGVEHLGEIKCAECGKLFKPTHHSQTLCSDECRTARRLKQQADWYKKATGEAEKAPVKKICKICGREFIATSPRQVMCSKECRMEEDRRYQRRHTQELKARKEEETGMKIGRGSVKQCVICGKPFTVVHGPEKYCSDACRIEGARRAAEKFYKKKSSKTAVSINRRTLKTDDYYQHATTLRNLIKYGVTDDIVAKYLQAVFGEK